MFTIATAPVWTKQSNFKLATKQTKTWPTPANAELGTAQPQLVFTLMKTEISAAYAGSFTYYTENF